MGRRKQERTYENTWLRIDKKEVEPAVTSLAPLCQHVLLLWPLANLAPPGAAALAL